jgi:hypothetical protein
LSQPDPRRTHAKPERVSKVEDSMKHEMKLRK